MCMSLVLFMRMLLLLFMCMVGTVYMHVIGSVLVHVIDTVHEHGWYCLCICHYTVHEHGIRTLFNMGQTWYTAVKLVKFLYFGPF
jgi:hypothetical protein